MISIINRKVAHIRPAYKGLNKWMADTKNARRGLVFVNEERLPKEDDFLWTSLFKIGKEGSLEEVIHKYETNNYTHIELEGSCLGCWYDSNPCDRDVQIRILEKRVIKAP
jgi:hypothetical protein